MELKTLGSKLAVLDENGAFVKSVMIYGLKEVLESTVGFYDENRHGSLEKYLAEFKKMITGTISDPYSIYWHTWRGKNFNMDEVVRKCVQSGCEHIVVEQLPDSSGTSMLF